MVWIGWPKEGLNLSRCAPMMAVVYLSVPPASCGLRSPVSSFLFLCTSGVPRSGEFTVFVHSRSL